MTYLGEHTWASTLGHFLTSLSFAGALLATAAFALGTARPDAGWTRLGRLGFRAHATAVLGIVVLLFIMLFNHWFEFDYVWKHSNREMPMRYILSCFWEGQEGSFLLWTFWHMVIGLVLIRKAGEWEAPVLAVVSLVQVFLATMVLGVFVGDVRIGSSPFMLIRELPENLGLPWTGLEDYLTRIPQFADGRGLNPLLQNYWMVIHPPTLFLGFATTLVPFAYAIAGLWTKRMREWMAPALPWTFFGVMVLGTGILMGGAWAYEALSFGGFWAWDPVENASLVPWLTLVGAGHLMMVNKRKETSLFTTMLLTLTTFLLVLYSTFLTRSGVLGDTSVHSFTGEGMLPGLLLFMLVFVAMSTTAMLTRLSDRRYYALLCVALLVIGVGLQVQVAAILLFTLCSLVMLWVAYRTGPWHAAEEEKLASREFWLFIGSLVLLLSAAQITFSTSVPVFNLLLEPFTSRLGGLAEQWNSDWLRNVAGAKLAPPADAKAHYVKWQVPFAFIIAMLVAVGQYLRWKDSDMQKFRRDLLRAVVVAALLTALGVWLLQYKLVELDLIALFFATVFAAAANVDYLIKVLKGKWDHAGASVAHVGFALVLLGALISTSRQQEISRNLTQRVSGPVMDLRHLNEQFDNNTDVLLYKGDTVRLGEHYVTYVGRRADGVNLHYRTDYMKAEPRHYSSGDTVRIRSSLFRAKEAHTASVDFLLDQANYWEPLENYSRRDLWHSPHWSATRPGTKAFTLEPFVQLNPRFGNVPEPSTRHWLHRDLYTHVRYAKLDAADSTDHMPERTFEKQIGDTIVTPTSVVVLDSLMVVKDARTDSMLGSAFHVRMVRLRVRDLYDAERWFEARPVVIYRGTEPVAGKGFEIPELRAKYDLATADPETGKVGLHISDGEFLVLQAIVFPGINILWIGCVLLALGTFMAVRQRLTSKPSRG
ncbi:MAG: cytochrome c biogenesis protein CcsA [Flavobacteriales bacterium]|nr:cytochrome c biogenesis protein CcsA [Flavobacteriales bacterium]